MALNNLRDASFEYGVFPTTKWDKAQENHITAASCTGSMYAIPTDAKDPDMSSAVMEALASESYCRVAPAFFETADELKNLVYGDYIIKGSIMYDFGRVYSVAGLNFIPGRMRSMVVANNKNWALESASVKEQFETLLADLVKKLGE